MAKHDEDFGAINTLLGNAYEKATELRTTLAQVLPQESLQNSHRGDLLNAINTHLQLISKAYLTLRKTLDRDTDDQVTSAANMGSMWMDAFERQHLRGVKATRHTVFPQGLEKTYQQGAAAVIEGLSGIKQVTDRYEDLAKMDDTVIKDEALLIKALDAYKAAYETLDRAMLELSVEQRGQAFPPPVHALQAETSWASKFQSKDKALSVTSVPVGRT